MMTYVDMSWVWEVFFSVTKPMREKTEVWISVGLTADELERDLQQWWKSDGEKLVKHRWSTAARGEDLEEETWC